MKLVTGGAIVALAYIFVSSCAPVAYAAEQGTITALRGVSATHVGTEAVVTIDANGVLPAPTIGTLDGPPRIFLDFAGVTTRTTGLARTVDKRILRVRVALNSVSPLVTRVVIDLTAQQPHRIEQATGRVMIFIGAANPPPAPPVPTVMSSPMVAPPPVAPVPTATPAPVAPPDVASRPSAEIPPSIPAVPSLPNRTTSEPPAIPSPDDPAVRTPPNAEPSSGSPSASPSRAPYRPPGPPPPAKDLERYRTQVSGVLLRLRQQQPLLESIETLGEQAPVGMEGAMEEFETLRQKLSAIKPPDSLRMQHDLLLQSARLGMTATRLRYASLGSADTEAVRNAASAAAGAILMLDRACEDLRCPSPPRR